MKELCENLYVLIYMLEYIKVYIPIIIYIIMENINQKMVKTEDENPVNRTSTKIPKADKLQIIIDSVAYNKPCGNPKLIKEWARDLSWKMRDKRLGTNISKEQADKLFDEEGN